MDEPANIVSDLLSPGAHPTVVSLPVAAEDDYMGQESPTGQVNGELLAGLVVEEEEVILEHHLHVNSAPVHSSPMSNAPVADMNIDAGELAGDELPEEPLPAASVAAKKHGRPSIASGKTPSKRATPARATTNTPKAPATAPRSAGRKRKAEETAKEVDEDEVDAEPTPDTTPAKRPRGRPAASAGSTSARLAAKAAKAPKRGRRAGAPAVRSSRHQYSLRETPEVDYLTSRQSSATIAATSPVNGTKRKPGRPKSADAKSAPASSKTKKLKETTVPKGEYEVEAILDSAIDADTLAHMYQVKWKGYPVSEATWEPKTNLAHAAELIRAFDAKKDKKVRGPKDAAPTKSTKAPKPAKATPGSETTKATAASKKAGRPAGRPRKTPTAEAPKSAVAKSNSKVVKKPGRPAKSPGRPAGRGTGRSAKSLGRPAVRSSGRPRRGVKA